MGNQSPILLFGITADLKRSSYWRVRAGTAKPELFFEREGYGKKWHFTRTAIAGLLILTTPLLLPRPDRGTNPSRRRAGLPAS